MKLDDLPGYVENFRRRCLQDAIATATSVHWRHRADVFEAARPNGYVWATDLRRHVPGCTRRKCPEEQCPYVHHAGEAKTDFPGRQTDDQIRLHDAELAEITIACRRHAELMIGGRL